VSASVFAQSPEKIGYQAVVRNSTDQLVATQNIGMQISIIQDAPDEPAVYVETQMPTTNVNGLISIEIGTGTVVSGDFSTIDWGTSPVFITTEIDITGGTNYTITSTSQLVSVPYSLHAKTAKNFTGTITESQISDLQDYATQEDIDLLQAQIALLENNMTSNLAIGDYFGGGIVFYIFQNGDLGYVENETHGLICDVNDRPDAHWADFDEATTDITGAEGTAIGTGAQNTIDITNVCQGEMAYLAAEVCFYSTNTGYTDWFLPSSLELNQIYIHKSSINTGALANGGESFENTQYWSSTELTATTAESRYMDDGTNGGQDKETSAAVRAVRAF
jgi:hypothetical protein